MRPSWRRHGSVLLLVALVAGCGDEAPVPYNPAPPVTAGDPGPEDTKAGVASDPVGASSPIIFGPNNRPLSSRVIAKGKRRNPAQDPVGASSPIVPPPR
ncbi:MAG: hypothetical protein P4L84_09705 [Isosphaeraceae bacterium]|nr:hypothetical protein [Isosphaeraceae bacterium]